MPDLTLESFAICASLVPYHKQWSVGGYIQNVNHQYELECSCKGYQYRKICKHVTELDQTRCTWNQFIEGGEPVDGRCPGCGGEIEYYMVGV